MNKIINNIQMLHILTEIIVISGITLYFSNKNKKITSHLEDISSRVDELEDLLSKKDEKIESLLKKIQKQDEVLKQLQKSINNINCGFKTNKSTPLSYTKKLPKVEEEKYSPKIKYVTDSPILNKKENLYVDVDVPVPVPEEVLDEELTSELADLEDSKSEENNNSSFAVLDEKSDEDDSEEIEEISSKTHLKKKTY